MVTIVSVAFPRINAHRVNQYDAISEWGAESSFKKGYKQYYLWDGVQECDMNICNTQISFVDPKSSILLTCKEKWSSMQLLEIYS